MDSVEYSSSDLAISHPELIRLYEMNKISMGVAHNDATAISLNTALASKSSRSAMLLWDWVAVGVFAYSIYASFAYHWWIFVIGYVVMKVIHRANKSANSTNVLEAAIVDEGFYERVALAGGWVYKISPDLAENYRR